MALMGLADRLYESSLYLVKNASLYRSYKQIPNWAIPLLMKSSFAYMRQQIDVWTTLILCNLYHDYFNFQKCFEDISQLRPASLVLQNNEQCKNEYWSLVTKKAGPYVDVIRKLCKMLCSRILNNWHSVYYYTFSHFFEIIFGVWRKEVI